MSQQPYIDWAEIKRVAQQSIAMGQTILAAVNSAQPRLLRTAETDADRARQIIRLTAEYYGYTQAELCSKSRPGPLAWARQVTMFLCRELTNASSGHIGQLVGKRNHATVLHAVKTVSNRMETEKRVAKEIDTLREQLLKILK